MQRFRGGLVFKAHRLCVSLNSRLESNKDEEEGCEPLLLKVDGFVSHTQHVNLKQSDGPERERSVHIVLKLTRSS